MTPLEVLVTIIWLSWLPFSLMFMIGLIRFLWLRRVKRVMVNDPAHFIIQITTNGRAFRSVEQIIAQIRSYSLPFHHEIWIVAEEYDSSKYSADRIVKVPASYRTANNTRFKARALCYAREERMRARIEDAETKILLLDDDSVPTKEYLDFAYHCEYDVAQGVIASRRDYGRNLLASIADNIRTADCLAFCLFFNSRGDARVVHGEGLLTRGNVEEAVGWDYGFCLAEDLIFGRKATRRFKFGFIPHFIEIAPPKGLKDFFRQRRRWIWGVLLGLKHLDNSEKLFILGRYSAAAAGALSACFAIYDIFFHFGFPLGLRVLFLLNSTGWISYYVLPNWFLLHRVRDVAKSLLLMYVAAFMEGVSTVFSLLFRPKGYDVIQK